LSIILSKFTHVLPNILSCGFLSAWKYKLGGPLLLILRDTNYVLELMS